MREDALGMLRFRAMTLLACARLGCRALRPPLARRRAATAVRAAAEALPGASAYHIPVLGAECVEWLVTDTSGVYVDATLGGAAPAPERTRSARERA